jgi:hypothetical protein
MSEANERKLMTELKKAVRERLSRVAFGNSPPGKVDPPSSAVQDFRVELTETGTFQFGGQNFQVLRHERDRYWFVFETKTGLGVGEDSKNPANAVRSAVMTILTAAGQANLGWAEYLQSRFDIHRDPHRKPFGIWRAGPRRSVKIKVEQETLADIEASVE